MPTHHPLLKWLLVSLTGGLAQCVPSQSRQVAAPTGGYSPTSFIAMHQANLASRQRLLYPVSTPAQPQYGGSARAPSYQQVALARPLPYPAPWQNAAASSEARQDATPTPVSYAPVPIADRPHPQTPPNFFVQNLDIEQHLVSPAALGHSKAYPMQAQYITIHSTGNASLKAPDFAARMARGDLISTPRTPTTKPGRLSWHYTVDEDRVIQHLPLDCQGGHADFNGPGNRTSIGIEMCENRGANLALTIERTARLAAYLMHLEHLPLTHVVPHHYWPRPTQQPVHKCCPHFLMERDGHPGAKWQHFIDRVAFYDQALAGSLAAR